jgi:hypothetical protein
MRALPRADIAANVVQTRAKPLGELPVNKVAKPPVRSQAYATLKATSKVASLKPPGDSENRK